ncbi:MAG: class I SAM-dependent methyltransferase [Dehalococcoidia bacterium]
MDEWFATLDDSMWLRPDEQGRDEAAFVKRVLRLRKGQSVLDAPCGAGRVACHLAKMGCRVTGVDLKGAFVGRAQERFHKEGLAGRFAVMDLRHLDFTGEFDGVVNWGGSFGYFTDAENVDVLGRYAKALRPGGRIVIDQPNRERVLRNFVAEMHPSERMTHRTRWDEKAQRVITERILDGKNDPRNASSMRLYTPGQIGRLFERVSLDVEGLRGSLFGDTYRRSSRRMIVVGRKRRD